MTVVATLTLVLLSGAPPSATCTLKSGICMEASGANAKRTKEQCSAMGGELTAGACPSTNLVATCGLKGLTSFYYDNGSPEHVKGLLRGARPTCQNQGGTFNDKRSGAKPEAPASWAKVAVPKLKAQLLKPEGCEIEEGMATSMYCGTGEFAGWEVNIVPYDPSDSFTPKDADASLKSAKDFLPEGTDVRVLKKEGKANSWKLLYRATPKASQQAIYKYEAVVAVGPERFLCGSTSGSEKFVKAAERVCASLKPAP
jgi:hypothetical protein